MHGLYPPEYSAVPSRRPAPAGQPEGMTVEILPDGGVHVVASIRELETLSDNLELATRQGVSHAPLLIEDGVATFVIEVEHEAPGNLP